MQSGVRTEISDIPVDRRVRVTAVRVWVHGETAAKKAAPDLLRRTPVCTGPNEVQPECGWEGLQDDGWHRARGLTTGNRRVSFSGSPPAARFRGATGGSAGNETGPTCWPPGGGHMDLAVSAIDRPTFSWETRSRKEFDFFARASPFWVLSSGF
jgi:hypothetical protein